MARSGDWLWQGLVTGCGVARVGDWVWYGLVTGCGKVWCLGVTRSGDWLWQGLVSPLTAIVVAAVPARPMSAFWFLVFGVYRISFSFPFFFLHFAPPYFISVLLTLITAVYHSLGGDICSNKILRPACLQEEEV